MALKFLNKKGWHTGSIRNIENVWKAEQKHEAEQKKLDELRKQIQEEKERSEFRKLQEQAGLVPRQERLEFLYDSGLSVGLTGGSDGGFKSNDALPSQPNNEIIASSSSASAADKQELVPGALFEEKPQSANDAWRKLHSDPLLMIRQREQEALARIKNNPVKMAMIRKSVESKKDDTSAKDKKHKSKRKKHGDHYALKQYDSEDADHIGREERNLEAKRSRYDHHSHRHDLRERSVNEEETVGEKRERYRKSSKDGESRGQRHRDRSPVEVRRERQGYNHHSKARSPEKFKSEEHGRTDHPMNSSRSNNSKYSVVTMSEPDLGPQPRRRNTAPKLSEEERAARLREMQQDAELHEEQRWKRLKTAAEDEAKEAAQSVRSTGRSFLDVAKKSVYGAEKGGSATIEESVRRRSHYRQGRSAEEGNAFRR